MRFTMTADVWRSGVKNGDDVFRGRKVFEVCSTARAIDAVRKDNDRREQFLVPFPQGLDGRILVFVPSQMRMNECASAQGPSPTKATLNQTCMLSITSPETDVVETLETLTKQKEEEVYAIRATIC